MMQAISRQNSVRVEDPSDTTTAFYQKFVRFFWSFPDAKKHKILTPTSLSHHATMVNDPRHMLLKEYTASWPPVGPQNVALDDVVLAVKNFTKGKLGLVIRKEGLDLTVPLSVPESLQQKIILDIVRKRNITLREVGELRIS